MTSEEDSRVMSGVGSYSIEVDLNPRPPMSPEDFSSLIGRLMVNIAEKISEGEETIIGHIKMFVKTPNGTVRANIIDLDLGVDMFNDLGRKEVLDATMYLMAAGYGLNDSEVKEIVLSSLGIFDPYMEWHVEKHHHGEVTIIKLE
jgi:hypothetical protein